MEYKIWIQNQIQVNNFTAIIKTMITGFHKGKGLVFIPVMMASEGLCPTYLQGWF